MSEIREKILIAEDQVIFKDALRALLSSEPQWEVVGEAKDGREAIRAVEKLKPSLVLMDLSMPRMNGLEAIQEIKKLSPQTKILVLTVHKTDDYIMSTFDAGADGYVLKDSSTLELKLAIRSVLKKNFFISPEVSGKYIVDYLKNKRPLTAQTPWEMLSTREKGILKLIAEGYRNREIADFLCISVKTVEKHRANLMKKLDLHSVSALTALAIQKGLTTNDFFFSRSKEES